MPRKSEIKREELLQSGIDLMYDKGFNGTSVKDVVDAAGVPKGSFYFYFDSKEDFALAAMDKYLQDTNATLLKALMNTDKSAKERLYDFYDLRIRQNIEQMDCTRGCFVNNMASEMANNSEIMRKRVLEMFERTVDSLADLIAEGQRAGNLETTEDAHLLAGALEDAWKGALITMKSCRCPNPLHNFRTIILTNLLR